MTTDAARLADRIRAVVADVDPQVRVEALSFEFIAAIVDGTRSPSLAFDVTAAMVATMAETVNFAGTGEGKSA